MSGWQVGDLALCTRPSEWAPDIGGQKGEIFRVVGLREGTRWDGRVGLGLSLDRIKGDCNADRFIKITPPEADEFDREVIDLLTKQPAEAI